MKNQVIEKAFTTRNVEGLQVLTMNQDASKMTLGGDGPIPESFRLPFGGIGQDWQAAIADFYG